MNIYSIVNFPCTGVDVYRRIQELFSFLFELGVIAQLCCRTTLCIDRAHHLSFRLSLRGRWGITAASGEQNKYHGRRQNQSGQFFQHFHVGTSSRFVVFFIICRVPFHFETGPPSGFILSNDCRFCQLPASPNIFSCFCCFFQNESSQRSFAMPGAKTGKYFRRLHNSTTIWC